MYRATLRQGGQEVAVKVQRPDVHTLVACDLFLLRIAAAPLLSRLGIVALRFTATLLLLYYYCCDLFLLRIAAALLLLRLGIFAGVSQFTCFTRTKVQKLTRIASAPRLSRLGIFAGVSSMVALVDELGARFVNELDYTLGKTLLLLYYYCTTTLLLLYSSSARVLSINWTTPLYS